VAIRDNHEMAIRIRIEIEHNIAVTAAVKDVIIPVLAGASDLFTKNAFFDLFR
jgi:hypothetical protein